MSLKHKAVYVVGPAFEEPVTMVFAERPALFSIVNDPEEADVIVLTGGEDINPEIYGEQRIKGVYWNADRDKRELAIIEKYRGKKCFIGICRGAQLLNCVLGGGTLWQHVNNHGGSCHTVWDRHTLRSQKINSYHHQQMRPGLGADVIAVAGVSTYKENGDKVLTDLTSERVNVVDKNDAEVIFYPEANALCFQAHPEFSTGVTRAYFNELLDRYVLSQVETGGGETCAA